MATRSLPSSPMEGGLNNNYLSPVNQTCLQKRKAEGEPVSKEEDTISRKQDKRLKATYTPAAPTRASKRATPARSKANMSSEQVPGIESSKTMERLFKDLGTSLTASLTKKMSEDFKTVVADVNGRVDANKKSIEEMQATIHRLERSSVETDKKIDSQFERLANIMDRQRLSTTSSHDDPFPLERELSKEAETEMNSERYAIARRFLRLWPVEGSDETQLYNEAVRFIRQKLAVDSTDCRDVDIIRVRRTKQPRKSSVKFEIAVVFIDKHVRDLVASNGKNLSKYKDREGWPTAGLRLEYPSALG